MIFSTIKVGITYFFASGNPNGDTTFILQKYNIYPILIFKSALLYLLFHEKQ